MDCLTDNMLGWIVMGFCAVLCIAATWACDFKEKHLQETSDMDYLLREQDDA